MDEIALRYLLLGLRLGRHHPRFVASYHGPGELSEAVDGEPLTPTAELHDEALQLAGMAAELPVETAALRRRRAWLLAQVTAIGALARWVGGEEIGYLDLVEELYDVEVQLEPETTFEAARRMVDATLPGPGPLRERLADHDRRNRVPADRVLAAASQMAGRLRARTRAQLWLPELESVAFAAVSAVPWAADGRYLGSGRSLIRINLDQPLTFTALVEVAAHHAYPGRHTEACVKEQQMSSAGLAELALIARSSPQALVSEGMAGLAREVVMGDQELGLEMERLAKSVEHQLDLPAELMLERARRLLRPALGNAAVALHRDGEPIGQVRSYLADVALVNDDSLDDAISQLTDAAMRTEPFAHIEGRRLVSEWLEVHGQTHGFARLLAEQLTPSALRSELVSS